MSVQKSVRSEIETVVLRLREDEYLQYVLSSRALKQRFSLLDNGTKENILNERTTPMTEQPTTFMRVWPIVGDRPQQETVFMLALYFAEPQDAYTFQVQQHRSDGNWYPAIDIDFQSPLGGSWYMYLFHVKAE